MSSRRSSVQSLTTSLPHLDLLWAGLQIAQSNRFLNTCNYTLLYLTTTRLCEPFGTILRMSRTRFHAFCSTSSRSPTHHPNVKIKTPLNTHLCTSTYAYHPTCRATSPQLNHTSSQVQHAFTNAVTPPDTPSKNSPSFTPTPTVSTPTHIHHAHRNQRKHQSISTFKTHILQPAVLLPVAKSRKLQTTLTYRSCHAAFHTNPTSASHLQYPIGRTCVVLPPGCRCRSVDAGYGGK
jgi:hypothetical protein